MIRFTTMIRKNSVNLKEKIANNCDFFIDINEETRRDEINQIIKQGVYYGYIKLQINGQEAFEYYHLQLLPLQWLRYIEILEMLLNDSSVKIEDPIRIELTKLADGYLKVAVSGEVFVVNYYGFVEQFVLAGKYYLEQQFQQTQDDAYKEVIQYLIEIEQQIYSEKV